MDVYIDEQYENRSPASDNTNYIAISSSSSVDCSFGHYQCVEPERTFDSMIDFAPTVVMSLNFIILGDMITHGTNAIFDLIER